VDAKSLGEMTVSMLNGEAGHQAKEIRKLLDWLRSEQPFDLINIPYSLLISLAEPLKRELNVPVCVTLQGDDLFLDQLGEPHRTQSMALIRSLSSHVDLFLPVSEYYRDYMPQYLGVPASKMRLVRLGINIADFAPRPRPNRGRPFTIGYFARVAPEKGFHVLVNAYIRFRRLPNTAGSRLIAAGYLPPEHQDYLRKAQATLEASGLGGEFEYRGETDRAGKVAFLHEVDVFSVPTTYAEPKGLFLMEAMACGIPVVQPRTGAFPEIIDRTGGGLIVDADPSALADGFAAIKEDPALAESLGAAGAAGVREHYSVERMADQVEAVYRELAAIPTGRR
jgi:glycosyltransferase involved in cell wall biosynthesis